MIGSRDRGNAGISTGPISLPLPVNLDIASHTEATEAWNRVTRQTLENSDRFVGMRAVRNRSHSAALLLILSRPEFRHAMDKIDDLADRSAEQVSVSSMPNLPRAQRGMLLVYDRDIERTLRARFDDFESRPKVAGHGWNYLANGITLHGGRTTA